VFNNWSPRLVADPDTIWLGLEYFCREGDELWSHGKRTVHRLRRRELEKIGMIDRSDVLDGTVVRVPKAYPAYFGEYNQFGKVRELIWSGSPISIPSDATACTATTIRTIPCWPPTAR
jgi:protoporphyrinogen oxidase